MTRPTLLLLLLLTTACTDADPGRGTAKACDPCTWDGDCADGFFCDTDGQLPPMVCKTAKMADEQISCDADCRGLCLSGGRCAAKMSENLGKVTCAPTSAADCQQSAECKNDQGSCGYCPGYFVCGSCN